LGRNAFVSSASGAWGVVASVILDALVMGLFGLSWVTDAYFVAATIPTIWVNVMTLLSSQVIQPLFISTREQSGEGEGWHFLSLVITMGTWLGIALGAVCAALSPVIVRIQAPGFNADAFRTGVNLSALFFLVSVLSWPIAIMRTALNSVNEFAISGSSKLIESVFKIVFVAALAGSLGIYALVGGMFAGFAGEVALFYYCLWRRGYRFHHCVSLRHVVLRRAARLLRYPVAGQGLGAVVEIVSNHLSSLLGPGKVTALRFATRIIDVMAGVLANGIVTVAMPAMASAVASRNYDRAKLNLRQAIHLLLLVTIPVSLWLAIVNRPLIRVLYERMSFTSSDVQLVSSVLLVSIPYIFLSRLWSLAELPFFAGCDTRTPMLVGLAQSALCVALTYVLFGPMGLYAYPIARSACYLIGALCLFHLASWRWGSLRLAALAGPAVRIAALSVVIGISVLLGQGVAATIRGGGFVAALSGVIIPSTLGVVSACCALVPLRVVRVRRADTFPFLTVRLYVTSPT
jgi:putative peptidoglycan lipid II flippase